MQQAVAAAHQRQLLLAAAANGSSRECVSHDACRPPFVCKHTGPDTYSGTWYRERSRSSTSQHPTQSQNRTTVVDINKNVPGKAAAATTQRQQPR